MGPILSSLTITFIVWIGPNSDPNRPPPLKSLKKFILLPPGLSQKKKKEETRPGDLVMPDPIG